MGYEVESAIWEPNPALYIFVFICCCLSIFYLPTKIAANLFDHVSSASVLRFQRNFILLFALSAVLEGSWAVLGEYEMAYFRLSKNQMVNSLCIVYAVAAFIGSFLGVASDLIGQRKFCLLFCVLHLSVNIWKIVSGTPAIWLSSVCLSLASSIYSFNFEAFMVVEHEKLVQRQESLNEMFWLMTLFESASFMGSQVIGNYLINCNVDKSTTSVWKESVVVALFAIIYVTRCWKGNLRASTFRDYRLHFHGYIVNDKRVWLLSWAQTCVHFSTAAFWILWAPTMVADGREISSGLIYPCLLGFKMLGSTGFPWFVHGPFAFRVEECLMYVFLMMGIGITVVAYDYQEMEFLMIIFCAYNACMGLVLPSLAHLRSMYLPNDIRGGMMSLSLMPANGAILFMLILRGYYQRIGNSMILMFAALGLFSASGCMYMLKKLGKPLHQSKHNP